MTTGRINQVATSRVTPAEHRDRCSAQHEVRKWVWSVIASLHQFRNCRVPLVRSSVRTERLRVEGRCRRKRPLLCQRCEIQSLFGTPPNHAIRHESLENDERTIFANHKSVQPHKGIGHPTKAGLPTDVKAKKEMQIRRPANQKFARCHLEAARGPQPERLLQSSRRIISCEKKQPSHSKPSILNFSTTPLDRFLERIFFHSPHCFMNIGTGVTAGATGGPGEG